MKHLTRDFLTLPSASCPGTNMYALAIFLIGCGGYKVVGQTNFPLSSGSNEVTHGIGASINMVAGPTDVFLPTASYRVSADDVNRILVLKSQLYPKANSGLFRVTAANPVTNTLTIDYRSSTTPPPEQDLSWYLFLDEYTASMGWRSGSNGTAGYGSYSPTEAMSASASRVVLRSPDPTSWQVRLCLESLQDISGACPSGFSIAPGYGTNTNGDYFEMPAGSGPGEGLQLHLHTALFHNTTESKYRGMVVGLTPCLSAPGAPLWTTGQWRISMIVDDWSGSAGIINRNVSLPAAATSGSGWACFGLCENEHRPPLQSEVSDPLWNCPRLFVVGSSNPQSNLTWRSQFHSDNVMQVVGFAKRGYPIPGVLSCYSDISNPSNSHVRYLTSSANTAWLNTASELLDVEVLVGTLDQTLSASTQETIYPIQPRRLGRLPFFMHGRANYPQWSTTTESTTAPQFYHAIDGVFMEWGGPKPTDSTTGAAYISTSGTIENQEGLRMYGAFLPGSDPIPDPVSPRVQDLDSTLFRKTYSYYRQVPVNVGVVKAGSNPPKP